MSSVLETIEDSFNYLSGQREIANTHVGTIGQTSLFNTQCPTLYNTHRHFRDKTPLCTWGHKTSITVKIHQVRHITLKLYI